MSTNETEYAGFWIRVLASIIDTVLILIIVMPIMLAVYGEEYFNSTSLFVGWVDFLLSWVAPAIAVILFWINRKGTPGKLALSLHVVDAKTQQTLTPGQCIGRYLGYYVSMIPLGLGLIWVGFDAKKQGWHDKLAGTVVIRVPKQAR